MNERNLNRLIVAGTVMAVAAIAIAGPLVFAPTPFEREDEESKVAVTSEQQERDAESQKLSKQLASLRFQEPVTIPTKAKTKVTKTPPPAIFVSDTIVGSRTQMATVSYSGKKFSVEPGDEIGNSKAKVISIATNRVTVSLANGERHTYTAPLPPSNKGSR